MYTPDLVNSSLATSSSSLLFGADKTLAFCEEASAITKPFQLRSEKNRFMDKPAPRFIYSSCPSISLVGELALDRRPQARLTTTQKNQSENRERHSWMGRKQAFMQFGTQV
jgi:hypothetical protein